MNMASWLLQYFDSPWYLLLLVLAPIMWYVSRESLSGMGTVRRFFALTLRTMVLLLIVGSLAEIQYRRINDRLTVIYVLDQSESIPKSQRDTMLNFVKADVSQYRNDSKRDRAAVIVFGRDASIEVPQGIDPPDKGDLFAGIDFGEFVAMMGSVHLWNNSGLKMKPTMKTAEAPGNKQEKNKTTFKIAARF